MDSSRGSVRALFVCDEQQSRRRRSREFRDGPFQSGDFTLFHKERMFYVFPLEKENSRAQLPCWLTFLTLFLEIHQCQHVKTITVSVSKSVYEAFQIHARKVDWKASELIREAMEMFRQEHMERRTSLLDRKPVSVGGAMTAIDSSDGILGAMLDDARD